MLREQKTKIGEEIGSKLEWERLEGKHACRIAIYNRSVNIEDRDNWGEQFKWLEKKLYKFYETFEPRVN